ncbi:hypothetical protein [Halomarina ordinaria]|uniref:Uncharacterized protein n=1 Tax=Halomarina ordinaria TaxID=3033939 RepID=A0ABD5U9W0_9EURY|nr:hypothetical protein [Halomarina sp. PSRA2]
MTEVGTAVSKFVDEWQEAGTENVRNYKFKSSPSTREEISDLLSDVRALSNYFDPSTVICHIQGEEDKYLVRYEPDVDFIRSEQEEGEEYEHDSLYPSDPSFADQAKKLRDNRVNDCEQLVNIFGRVIERDDLDLELEYGLEKSRVATGLSDELSLDDTTIEFHISWEYFITKLHEVPPEKFRDRFLEKSKLLIVVLDSDEYVYGDNLAVSGINTLNDFIRDFSNRDITWQQSQHDIAPNSLIDDIDRKYLPPVFFEFDELAGDNAEFHASVLRAFNPYVIVYSLLSFGSRAEHIDDSKWRIRISGKQFIEGVFSLSSDKSTLDVELEESTDTIKIDSDLADSLYSLHKWAYHSGQEVENRTSVLRNVATLFARNLTDVITNAGEIESSARSNRRYYLEQSIDEFFEFRREVIDSAFSTHEKFSSLRSELMDDLSRDIFRTVAFIIAIAASVYFKLGGQFGTETVVTVILAFVLGYVLITFRRIRGIQTQFGKLIDDRDNSIQFYGRFFDDEELTEYGLNPSSDSPRWGSLFETVGWIEDGFRLEYVFLLDVILYYLLLGTVSLISIILLIDIFLWNIFPGLP